VILDWEVVITFIKETGYTDL